MASETTPLLNHDGGETNQLKQKAVCLAKDFGFESKKLWKIAGPAIFTTICQYSLGALTQTFAGLVGEIELAAVSVENSVVAGLAFGVMVNYSIFYYFYFVLSGTERHIDCHF